MSDRTKAEAELKAAKIALARSPRGMERSWALNRVIVAERAVAAAK